MSTDIAILRCDEWLFSLGGTRHARMCAGTSKSFKSEKLVPKNMATTIGGLARDQVPQVLR